MKMKKGLAFFAIAMLGGLASIAVYEWIRPEKEILVPAQPSARFVNMPVATGSGELVDFTYAAEKSVDAVVHVWTERVSNTYNSPWSQFFGYQQRPRISLSSGSGVIVSSDGFIVTNNHVVEQAKDIKIKMNTGEIYDAEVIGTDRSTDLALLKMEGKDFPYMPYGNSDQVKVGQWVLAVGNPFNLTSTVTAGIVSAKARNINLLDYDPRSNNVPLESFIQTDAAVNPGNSGGALVGINGELIGINTAIASNTGSYAGYSFAIPVNIVKKVVNDLYEFGHVQRAFIGVQIRDLNKELVDRLELPSFDGVYIAGLSEGGAAKDAGIEVEDVIVSVGNVDVSNVTQLQEQIGKYRPGDEVAVRLLRNGKPKTLKITLRNMRGSTDLETPPLLKESQIMGATFRSLSPEELGKLNLTHGIQLQDIGGSVLSQSGMRNGFIITRIDKKPVKDVDELKSILHTKKGGGMLIEGYYPNGTKAYYGFGL